MIFAGDVAIANGDWFTFHQFPTEVQAKPWYINLEGAIAGPAIDYSETVLCSFLLEQGIL